MIIDYFVFILYQSKRLLNNINMTELLDVSF